MPLALTDQGAWRAKLRGRAYWRLSYTDGRVVNEWDCDWSLAPLPHRQRLRLYCPNGQIAELGNSWSAAGRLFQLKGATLALSGERTLNYQLIGLVEDSSGVCTCAAWDYGQQKLLTFKDNVFGMRYEQIGRLSFEAVGLHF